MSDYDNDNMGEGVEVQPPSTQALDAYTRSEITQQQAYAKDNPRSLATFKRRALEMVTLDQDTAKECFYSLPRNERGDDGEYTKKMITGPSARLAEIVVSAWGNCRATARVVGEDDSGEFIRAQGAFHDLESNYAVCFEVRRRITTSRGKKYTSDMIGVTGNAAASIAFRNAVFKGVPKALWNIFYKAAMKTAVGDLKTLDAKRKEQVSTLNKMGIPNDVIFGVLAINGIDDILADQLIELQGLENAIREGDTTVDDVLATWARQRLEAGTQAPSQGMFHKSESKLREAMDRAKSVPAASTQQPAANPVPTQSEEEKLKADLALAQQKLEELNRRKTQEEQVLPKPEPSAAAAAPAETSSEPPEASTSGQESSTAGPENQTPLLSPTHEQIFGGHKLRGRK